MPIRPTTALDAPLLPAIEQSAGQAFLSIPELAWIAHDSPQSPQRHLELLAQGLSWVAVDDSDRPVGFLNAEVVDGELYICETSVHQDHQRKGVGRALMDTVKEHARREGYPGVVLTTFKDVPWNAKFYASVGFAIIPEEELSQSLNDILAKEAAAGLPRDKRCAMRYTLL